MKILILGNSGCGKSTLARKLAKKYNIACCHMDDLVWNGQIKRPHEIRTELLNKFLSNNNSWVIEGMSHSEWMKETYELCDYFFLLKINNIKAWGRIYKRYLKKKFGLEKGHKETLQYLRSLHKIRKDYTQNVIPEIKQKMQNYKNKSFVVHNFNQVIKIIDKDINR